jgi:phosphate starvation-inducible PhoH-like protein
LEAVEGIDAIGITRFDERDVVRHPLVAKIVGAYDARDRREAGMTSNEAQGTVAPRPRRS